MSTTEFHFQDFKQEFENSSIEQAYDPNYIQSDELLNEQKDIFKKLKFIYLEQETRDKFLRKISSLADLDDEPQIIEIQNENKHDKLTLKELKSLMNETSADFTRIGKEVNELYDLYMNKLSAHDKLMKEIEQAEQEIEKLTNGMDQAET